MKNHPVDYPEFAVTRKRLSSYFSPPLARSTFYDLVNRGKIQPVSGVRGYYRLNASLQRMGMPVVKELQSDVAGPVESTGATNWAPAMKAPPEVPDLNPLLWQMVVELVSCIVTSLRGDVGLLRPQGPAAELLRTSTLTGWLALGCGPMPERR